MNAQRPRRGLSLTSILVFAGVLLVSVSCIAPSGTYRPLPPPTVQVAADVGFFYDQLTPYGVWVEIGTYGWVWRPAGMPVGWQPYSYGHWVWTVDGWLWVSDWSWGWAPFHYGRWSYDVGYGWVWIPGRVWAPAWVAWRSGGGWIGWAPLPPAARWRVGFGLDFGRFDVRAGISYHHWLFIGERNFLDRRPRHRFLHPARNVTVFDKTRDITRYSERERRAINHGPDSDRLGELTGKALVARSLRSADAPPRAAAPGRDQRGKTIEVYRPKIGNDTTKGTPSVRGVAPDKPTAATSKREREVDRWAESRRKELTRIHESERKKAAADEEKKRVEKRQATERKELDKRVERQKQVRPPTVKRPPAAKSPKRPSRPPASKAPPKKAKPKKPPGDGA